MSKIHNVNCAGQFCPERDDCKRYVKRVAGRVKVDDKDVMHHEWASFDLERERTGSCAVKDPVQKVAA